MAQFFLQGRLKLILNGENPVQCKLIGGNRSNGLLGFADFCSIYPSNINDHSVRRNGYSRRVTFIASAKGNSRNSVNGEVNENVLHERSDDFDDFADDEDDDDFSCFRGLVLDIAYRPVNVVCWKRAICLEFMDKFLPPSAG
ncbi:unnamed protein product [Amaranthus hypochondriacus]